MKQTGATPTPEAYVPGTCASFRPHKRAASNRIWLPLIVLGSMAVAGSSSAAPPVALPGLAPHLAVYALDLKSAKLGGGITGVSGRMTYKFGDSCDGWTVENRTNLTFSYSDGAPVETLWNFVAWESKDGRQYRFRVRSLRDGALSEEIDGTATLSLSHGGTAKFSQPEPRIMVLPKGTRFPTDHTLRMLKTASKGGHLVSAPLFDGSTADGVVDVSVAIGNVLPSGTPDRETDNPAVDKNLLAVPSWPVQMAFFPPDQQDAVPDYEITLRYYGNGVADEMIQSFGSFSLKGRLERLEMLPKPDC